MWDGPLDTSTGLRIGSRDREPVSWGGSPCPATNSSARNARRPSSRPDHLGAREGERPVPDVQEHESLPQLSGFMGQTKKKS